MELHKKIEKVIFLSNACQTAILQKAYKMYTKEML